MRVSADPRLLQRRHHFTASFPFTGSTLHIDVLTNGPAAVGGVVLTAIGLLLLLWAVLAAIVGQIGLLFSDRHRDPESLLGQGKPAGITEAQMEDWM